MIWKYTYSHHNPILLKHWALATLAFLTFIDYSNYSVIFPLATLSSLWKANLLYTHMMDFFFLILFLNYCIYFNWKLITLQYCSGFCHTLTWISHGCTCVPHPEPASQLPPHLIPQGHPSAPALSALSHAHDGIFKTLLSLLKCLLTKETYTWLFPNIQGKANSHFLKIFQKIDIEWQLA